MTYRYDLTGKWEFSAVKGKLKKWMAASVPGCLHTDLMARKIIPDPFYRFNEHTAVEHERSDWSYRKRFKLGPAEYRELSRKNVRLVCEGLDTFASVKLNGKLLGRTENMFVEHEFDIKKALKQGTNELVITFESAVRVGDELKAKHGETCEGYPYETRSYVRKAQYSFGWDWGPVLPTMGIWKDIYIEAFEEKIRDVHTVVISADAKKAEVKVLVTLDTSPGREIVCHIGLGKAYSTIKRKARKKSEVISEKFVINRPDLWWPNGYGKPSMYPLSVKIELGGEVVDTRETRVGIRTVELVREKDDEGECFYFKINGVPVYCKGCNFIPTDNFLPRTTDEKYRKLLTMAHEANMNMLRIWGGGIYEKDIFYNLCDELGIMVWQDFMFACAIYPHKPFYTRNVAEEARKVIKRLRNHPSVTIWSGENEDHIWFGENKVVRGTRVNHTYYIGKNWQWGQKIYHEVLPEACAELDPSRPYVSGSPIGEGPTGELNANGMKVGDRHAWDVWSGWQDYYEYQKDTGRFQSEFGFQGPPTMETIRQYTSPEDLHPQSRWMDQHNKMGEGNPRLYKFLSDHFVVPTDLDEFVYVCQLNQGEALKIGVEHFRRRKFMTAGALIWQMNDCWPVISWSLVDGESRPKLSYFFAKRFFADLLISMVEKDGKIEVWVTNDTMKACSGEVSLRSFSFSGRKRASKTVKVRVPANSSRRCVLTDRAGMRIGSTENDFVNARLMVNKSVIAENNLLFDRIKHLALPEPAIERSIKQVSDTEFQVELRSKVFAKGCTVLVDGIDVELSDNAFDLIPGEAKCVTVKTPSCMDAKNLAAKIKTRAVKTLKTDSL